VGFKASFRYAPDKATLNFRAGPDTTGAENTFVQIHKYKGIRIRIDLITRFGGHIAVRIKTVEASPLEEFVIRIIGFVALIMIDAQQKL
jgi:hypothetical protein